jgi:N-carbamoyl-L-amino-acid hydrolase
MLSALISRRGFLRDASAAWVAIATELPLRAADPRVDAAKLRARLDTLSAFGRPDGGTFADGVSRTAYSDSDIAGRRYFMSQMREAGLEPRIDAAGNIFGRRGGNDDRLPVILFGSHIDSVPNGGNFDGDLGSFAALSAIEGLGRAGVRTRHPLEMVVWAHEEGFAFGRGMACSSIAAGDFSPSELEKTWNGMTRAEAIRKIGGNPDRIHEARRPKGSHHCYLELHIEQGANLERASTSIGIVEGIVALHGYDVTITGIANHAGTTRIDDRHDAMLAAAHLTVAVRDVVTRAPGRQVGTVGHLEVTPNSPNVIPGLVRMSIDLRDLSPEKLVTMTDEIRQHAREIAVNTKTTIEFAQTQKSAPATADADVQRAVGRAADAMRLTSMRLPSGAGHDAQEMALIGPMGMIFVPSVGGISHSAKELTLWDDCAHGADVLLKTILQVDAL